LGETADFMNQPANLTWLWKEGRTNIDNEEFADLLRQLDERQRRGDKITHGEALSFLRSRGLFFLPPEPPQFVQTKLDHGPTLLLPNKRKPKNTGRDLRERNEEIDRSGASSEETDTKPDDGQRDEEHSVKTMLEEALDTAENGLSSLRKQLQEGLITEEDAAKKRQTILDEIDRQYMMKYGRTKFTAR